MKYTLITVNSNDQMETLNTRSINKAYAAYDKAIKENAAVISFTNSMGKDMQDRTNQTRNMVNMWMAGSL